MAPIFYKRNGLNYDEMVIISGRNIVVMVADGGLKYLSTSMFRAD